jgi:addiction module HigA family antidote
MEAINEMKAILFCSCVKPPVCGGSILFLRVSCLSDFPGVMKRVFPRAGEQKEIFCKILHFCVSLCVYPGYWRFNFSKNGQRRTVFALFQHCYRTVSQAICPRRPSFKTDFWGRKIIFSFFLPQRALKLDKIILLYYSISIKQSYKESIQMAKAVKTPGEVVKAQAAAYNLSITQLAEGIKISPSAARLLINNKLRISVSFAQRLSKFFGKTPKYWIDLQTAYELGALSDDKKETAVLKTISKAVKAPVTKKAAAKTTAKKTPGRKAGPGRPAKNAAAKAPAAKKAAAQKAPARKAAAKKDAAPKARRTVRKATPKTENSPSSFSPTSPWTPGSND